MAGPGMIAVLAAVVIGVAMSKPKKKKPAPPEYVDGVTLAHSFTHLRDAAEVTSLGLAFTTGSGPAYSIAHDELRLQGQAHPSLLVMEAPLELFESFMDSLGAGDVMGPVAYDQASAVLFAGGPAVAQAALSGSLLYDDILDMFVLHTDTEPVIREKIAKLATRVLATTRARTTDARPALLVGSQTALPRTPTRLDARTRLMLRR